MTPDENRIKHTVPLNHLERQCEAHLQEWRMKRLEVAEARMMVLETALRTYGQHKFECALLGTQTNPLHAFVVVNAKPCDCGLDDIIQRR